MGRTLFGVAIVALFAVLAYTSWLPAAGGVVQDDLRTQAELVDPVFTFLMWSADMKAHEVDRLIRGEVTLVEAAAVFRAAESRRPPGVVHASSYYRGATIEERTCREVIQHVKGALECDPNRRAMIECLQAELDDLLSQGALRLPERVFAE
jgi:hypothetical protein